MRRKLNVLLFGALTTAALLAPGSTSAYASPAVVNCGAGTHAVVRHPFVNGHRVRRVVCERNVFRRGVVGTTGSTVARCGPGTGAVVHHPVSERPLDSPGDLRALGLQVNSRWARMRPPASRWRRYDARACTRARAIARTIAAGAPSGRSVHASDREDISWKRGGCPGDPPHDDAARVLRRGLLHDFGAC